MSRPDTARFLATLLVLPVLALLAWTGLRDQILLNVAAKLTVAALAHPDLLPAADTALARLPAEDCHTNWHRGFVAQARGNTAGRDAAWSRVIRCGPTFITMLQTVAGDNWELAQQARREQPGEAESWFWAARVRSKEHPDEAIALYREGLMLNPRNGHAWREFGDLLVRRDRQAGIAAYLQWCSTESDDAYVGCSLAGEIAESLGDRTAAIRYYRLSRWPAALDRATQLEQEPRARPSP